MTLLPWLLGVVLTGYLIRYTAKLLHSMKADKMLKEREQLREDTLQDNKRRWKHAEASSIATRAKLSFAPIDTDTAMEKEIQHILNGVDIRQSVPAMHLAVVKMDSELERMYTEEARRHKILATESAIMHKNSPTGWEV